jgi:multidrug transporter EmrE-like cation transporter
VPNFLFIAGCLVFTVLGQLFIKKGAIELRGATSLLLYVLNPWVVIGLASALIAAASWIKALQHYRLNYAYPFMSLSFLAVAVLSAVVFNEELKPQQLVGLGILLLGLFVGSR